MSIYGSFQTFLKNIQKYIEVHSFISVQGHRVKRDSWGEEKPVGRLGVSDFRVHANGKLRLLLLDFNTHRIHVWNIYLHLP